MGVIYISVQYELSTTGIVAVCAVLPDKGAHANLFQIIILEPLNFGPL